MRRHRFLASLEPQLLLSSPVIIQSLISEFSITLSQLDLDSCFRNLHSLIINFNFSANLIFDAQSRTVVSFMLDPSKINYKKNKKNWLINRLIVSGLRLSFDSFETLEKR